MVNSGPRNKDKILTIHIKRIHVSPEHIRQTASDITPLKETIADVGLLQPILVRQISCGYMVIDGARRLSALKELGVQELIIGRDVIIDENETEADEKFRQLIANVQREDINDIELGYTFVALKEHFGYDYKEIAEIIGKTPHYVTAKVGLAKRLSLEVQSRAMSDREALKCIQSTFSEGKKCGPYAMNANILEEIARLPMALQMGAYESVKTGNMGQDTALRYIHGLKKYAKTQAEDPRGDGNATACGPDYRSYNICLKKINREINNLSISFRSSTGHERDILARAIKSLAERLNTLYMEANEPNEAPKINVYSL